MVWANIKSKKLQSLALGAVFVAVSILFFISLTLFGTAGEYEGLYTESKTSQALIYVSGEDTKNIIVDYLKEIDAIEHLNILVNFDDIIETNVVQEENLVPIVDAFFTEYATGDFDQIKIVEGKSTHELQENELIFSYGKSKLNNINVGDKILVTTEQGIREMVIAGIGVDLTYNFDTITLNRFWTTKETIDSFGSAEQEYSIGISYYNYTKDAEQQIFDGLDIELGDRASDILLLPYSLILNANSFFQVVMGAIFTLIGIILIVVGLFVIRSVVFNNIVTESKKIATLKSTGFSSNNIVSMYLLEYGVIAIISIVMGFLGSLVLSDVVLSDLNELNNLFGVSSGINVVFTIVVLIIILLIIEITVYLVARGVSKVNPAVALNRGEQVNETKAVYSLIKHTFMPITLVLAIKDIFYNRKMIITLVIFIIATTFTIITLSSASYSLNSQKNNNELWLGYDIDAKLVSSTPLDLDSHQSILDTLESSDYVKGTVTVYTDLTSQIYDDNNQKYISSISQVFVTDDTETLDFSVIEGRLPDNEGEIMIANNLLRNLEKEIGDYVKVRSLGEDKELLIVGECQSLTNQGLTYRIFLDEIDEVFLNNSLIQVNFVEGVDDEELYSEIEHLFDSDITLLFEYANASMVSMFDVLSIVSKGIIAIFGVICLIVLLNLNITNVNKERFNYGIYKSIGMNDQAITNIYLFKNSIVNIVGIIIGGGIAIITVPGIMNGMTSSLGISEFPTTIYYTGIVIAIGIVFLVTFINAIIIKKNISSITPKELLVE
jgi:putative ABC transport system permease protein